MGRAGEVIGGGEMKNQKMGWRERGMSGAAVPSSHDGRFLLFLAGNKRIKQSPRVP